ncbi:threonine--tRNA ligase [Candidatus Uhrbacteria bacterium]|nr:threonine--tRNA ligase [Candidatus Uhrbacteria bacterium]
MENDKLHAMRHTAAHVLAAAASRLYPGIKLGVGPVVENGFFYDILFATPITEEDLEKLEAEMRKIVAEGHEMVREEISIDEAIKKFGEMGQDFKIELLRDLKEKGTTKVNPEEAQDIDVAHPDVASLYHTGEFVDLCRGPHVGNVKEVGAFKLWKLAGAYWRGKEENPQMQRIYGLAFETQQELDQYLTMLEEAKKRDHRKLGAELGLFAFSPLVGSGLPLFTPKGTTIRRLLDEFVWSLMKPYGYEKVWIPHLAKSDLYKTSGHWDKFADDIFHVSSKKSEEEFVLKPMNCPHHTQIYASEPRSYRDLPLRLSEVTTVYRDENTGQLAGLTRVRSITQDDAHIFCRMDQVKDEARAIYEIITKFYKAFNMPLSIRLSVNDPDTPEKYLGGADVWENAVATLKGLLDDLGKDYELGVGEAAFYGPKIDFMAHDAIGRTWQLATIQLDFNQPERFGLEYADSDGTKKRPVMVHRAISGSLERFTAVLIEHYAGAFPFWIAPVQLRLATVSDEFVPFAKTLQAKLAEADIRVDLDDSNEKVGKKIRNSATHKIPWTIVIGAKEVEGGDFKVNVFGQDEDLIIPAVELVDRALRASQFPQ